jgi:phage terminase small subunit
MAKLTPKQEAFCQAICNGMNQSDAYRLAYNAANMKQETVNKRASELVNNGEVKGRVQELRDNLEAKQLWTREQSINKAVEAIEMACKNGKPLEILKGVEVLNKMHGYDAPIKHDVKSTGGFNINIVTTKKDLEND